MEPYHKNEGLHEQYLKYKYERINKLMKFQEMVNNSLIREHQDITRSYNTNIKMDIKSKL